MSLATNLGTNPMVEKLKNMTSPSPSSFKLPKVFNSAGFEKIKGGLTAVSLASGYNNVDGITKIMILIMAFFFFFIFFWCYNKLNLDNANCKTIEKLYTDFPLIRSINPVNPIYGHKLRDYYIKTAYNCCSAGIFKNDFVNLCALKSCIKQGARCLDFEIYSIDNEPVIAISSKVNFTEKGSYNSIPFSSAMTVISTYAFSGSTAPNANDPLILHFRIMSNNTIIHDQMATILYNTLENRLLGKKFSFENGGTQEALNLGGYQLSLLMGKVVIMVDKANPLFTSTRLYEYVNIASNAVFVRSLRYSDVKYSPDTTELTTNNKQNMSIVLPDVTSKNNNFSPSLAMSYGCQMIALSFQNFDSNMEYYTRLFDDAGSAFILKEEKYRYIPIFVPIPVPPPKEWSYETRRKHLLAGLDDIEL